MLVLWIVDSALPFRICRSYLKNHLLDSGMSLFDIVLNLGKDAGDLLKMPLEMLKPPIDVIMAGPPCPPWAGQGLKKSTNDDRAKVFLRLLEWVVYCIKACGLLLCVLENVIGITAQSNGRDSIINYWLTVLRRCCPEFEWKVHTLKLVEYLGAQTRKRVFLVGMRRILGVLPNPLPPFGPLHIRRILGHFPESRSQLCENQKKNLRDYEEKIAEMYDCGQLSDEDVVVVNVDRAVEKRYSQQVTVNLLPTLTTKSSCLMVLSVLDSVLCKPDSEREFIRHVRSCEKLVAQGFPKTTALFMSSGKSMKAAGNAYPVQLVSAVLNPIMVLIAAFDLASWPHASILSSHEDAMVAVSESTKLFAKPPPKLPAKTHSKKSVEASRKRKRKRRNE